MTSVRDSNSLPPCFELKKTRKRIAGMASLFVVHLSSYYSFILLILLGAVWLVGMEGGNGHEFINLMFG